MKKPNLFIVGAPKCGTTALHAYLAQHSDICMSDPKEPNYFSSLITSFSKNDDDYVSYCFEHYTHESVVGEASPLYLACPYAAVKIKQFNKNAKIIIMLRQPVDMMYSLHSEFYFSGSELEGDFSKALQLETARLNGNKVQANSDSSIKLAYRHMTNYQEQIKRYFAGFESNNILVVLQEDMHKDTAKVYKEVLTFLGVDNTFFPEFPRVNANKKIRSKGLRTFLTTPPDWMRSLARSVLRNESLQHAIRHKMRKLNQKVNAKNVQRESMSPSLYNHLLSEKKDEILELSQLLGRDLSHWLIQK
jgi:hypothetical protein